MVELTDRQLKVLDRLVRGSTRLTGLETLLPEARKEMTIEVHKYRALKKAKKKEKTNSG